MVDRVGGCHLAAHDPPEARDVIAQGFSLGVAERVVAYCRLGVGKHREKEVVILLCPLQDLTEIAHCHTSRLLGIWPIQSGLVPMGRSMATGILGTVPAPCHGVLCTPGWAQLHYAPGPGLSAIGPHGPWRGTRPSERWCTPRKRGSSIRRWQRRRCSPW